MNELKIIEYQNQRVLTTQQLAEAYGANTDTITKNFNRNKERYVVGKHFICLEEQALKDFKTNGQIDLSLKLNKLYLWTERGAFLHAKSLNTDKAWEVYDSLVEHYFKSREAKPSMLPTTYKEALLQLVAQVEQNEKLELENKMKDQQINELKPKADYCDVILQNKGLSSINAIAKDYGMSGIELNKILHELGVQYRQGKQWLLYSKYQDKGYTQSQTIDITRSDGRADITMHTKWTQKGRLFLYELLKKENVLPVIEQ